MSKTENKKMARKKKPQAQSNAAKARTELKEMLKEFDSILADGYVAASLSTNLAAETGKKIGALIESKTLCNRGLTLATNFANISKAIAILKRDMDNIKEHTTFDNLIAQEEYNRSFSILTAGQQLTELIEICQNRVVPAVALLEEQYVTYMEDKTAEIKDIVIAPTFSVGEGGKTKPMAEEDAEKNIKDSVLDVE